MTIPTPLRSKLLTQTRSSSLPSRSHPLIPQFNDHLHRLHAAAASPPSLSSLAATLTHLDDLHSCIHDLLNLPHTRHLFSRDANEKWVEQTLDASLVLVDAAATAKDALCHAKHHLLLLLPLLRRRRDPTPFLTSRKSAQKSIHKSLKKLTNLKQKPSVFGLDKDAETIAVITMLKEAEAATLDLVESLLCSLAGNRSASASRLGAWSRVAWLIGTRKYRCSGQDHKPSLEFWEIDAVLDKIVGFQLESSAEIEELRLQLRETEGCLRVVEERVEGLFKRLIKTRVSLLNMYSN